MKILHIIHTPRHSGAESLVVQLSTAHASAGVAVAVASFGPAAPEFSESVSKLKKQGVGIFFPKRVLGSFNRVQHLQKVCTEFKPDVIYAHSVLPALYARLLLTRAKVIPVLHAATNDDYAERVLELSEKILTHRASTIVAVSDEAARSYHRRFARHLPRVIKNGINVSSFVGVNRSTVRDELCIPPAKMIILQVGRIAEAKNQAFSVRALSSLLRSWGGRAEFWMAGLTEDARYEAEVRRIIQEEDVGNFVRFLGARPDVPELLAACDVYVMPSQKEAHSVALIEALASGAPLVISDIPTFQFAIRYPGVDVLGLSDAEAFRQSVERLLGRGERFTRSVEEYDVASTADQYLALAKSISAV